MNFLAHAYLSFNEEEILAGNMMSDFVKGKKKFDYAINIQKGIALHRLIDEFTDNHEATKQAKQFLKHAVGLYSGAFIDVVYDHFLANDKNEFANDDALKNFSNNVYHQLSKHQNIFPDIFKKMFHYMQEDNWLFNYKQKYLIEKSFSGIAHRAKFLTSSTEAFKAFEKNYLQLQNCYNNFFPQLKKFAFNKFSEMKNKNSF